MSQKLKDKIGELQGVIAFCYGATKGADMLGEKSFRIVIQVIQERIEQHPDWKPDESETP